VFSFGHYNPLIRCFSVDSFRSLCHNLNMMNNTQLAAKNILAKLLATENLRIEHDPQASTASFDLKNRTLRCPVWEAMDGDMYDMLLSHEVSHAKNTPFKGWHTTIESQDKKKNAYKHFLNIVEDARIEKLIKRQYPGLRRPFLNAYKNLFERDLFKVKGVDPATLYFIDRVNMHCKLGFAMNIRFTAEERALLNLVEQAETWDDVVNATKLIWEYSKEEQQNDTEQKRKRMQSLADSLAGDADEDEEEDGDWDDDAADSDEDEDENEDGDWDDDAADSDSEDDEDGEDDATTKAKDGDKEDGDEEDGDDDSTEESDKLKDGKGPEKKQAKDKEKKTGDQSGSKLNRDKESQNPTKEDFVPQAKTDEAFRENEKQLIAKNAPEVVYVNLPTPQLKNIVVPAAQVNQELTLNFSGVTGRELLAKFKEKNQSYINSLAKEFEMKKAARTFSKSKVSESGDINISKLGLFRTEDDIFKKITTTQKGKSHGLFLLLDKSGSMTGNMAGAIEQLLVLANFCRKVNVPFVAYGYTNIVRSTMEREDRFASFSKKNGELKMSDVGLREIINSNMKAAEFTQVMKNQLCLADAYENPSGENGKKLSELSGEFLYNTPLNEALVASMPLIDQFKKGRKLDLVNMVILHDGDADWNSYVYQPDMYSRSGGTRKFESSHQRVYFRDPVSKIEMLLDARHDRRAATVALMTMLKERCGVGIYGFFIGGEASDIRTYYVTKQGKTLEDSVTGASPHERRINSMLESKGLMKQLNSENFLESWTPGYNRFYLIPNGRKLKVVDNEIVIKGSVTARKLSTAFIKQGKAKYSNRVLVSRFIEGIAK
jgi:hypothetical protein